MIDIKRIIFFFSLIILVGCTSQTPSGIDYNFKQGVNELQLSTVKNAPPSKIFENSEFPFLIELHNKAAYDLIDGELSIIGLDKKYFYLSPPKENFALMEGRSLQNPVGDKIFIEFQGQANELFEGAERYTDRYVVQAKYSSTMEFVDSICIDPDVYDVFESGCKMRDRKSYRGQGSPLGINQLEQILTPGTSPFIELRLQLRNMGKGELGTVTFTDAKLGANEISCQFKGTVGKTITFDKKRPPVLICKHQLLRNVGSYTTTLLLGFSFDYKIEEIKTLNIFS